MTRSTILNSAVTVIKIENNIQKVPSVWAEEATEEIMKLFVVTGSCEDPYIREKVLSYKLELRGQIFELLLPVFRRAITCERTAIGGKK